MAFLNSSAEASVMSSAYWSGQTVGKSGTDGGVGKKCMGLAPGGGTTGAEWSMCCWGGATAAALAGAV